MINTFMVMQGIVAMRCYECLQVLVGSDALSNTATRKQLGHHPRCKVFQKMGTHSKAEQSQNHNMNHDTEQAQSRPSLGCILQDQDDIRISQGKLLVSTATRRESRADRG
jgi:hypothetical protein